MSNNTDKQRLSSVSEAAVLRQNLELGHTMHIGWASRIRAEVANVDLAIAHRKEMHALRATLA